MASRRMFSKDITESDAFADMPLTSQALYFHLGMNADDDGFVNNAKKVQRGIGASSDDLNLLIAKKFLIPFESGVVVIKHWRVNNYIRDDRKTSTKYEDELAELTIKSNGVYTTNKYTTPLIEEAKCVDHQETLRQAAYSKSSLPYSFDYKIRQAFYGEPCPMCGTLMMANVDECGIGTERSIPSIQHNIPISKGGEHELGNISVICLNCNITNQDKPTDDLNAEQVIRVWEGICLENDGQMPGKCQASIGKDSIGKNSKYILSGKPDHSSEIAEIVAYLNARVGTSYRPKSKSTSKAINARLEEGFSVDDCKAVIDDRASRWLKDSKMREYLRPSTLFAPSKFEGYLQAAKTKAVRSNAYSEYD